jgi:hypothetical protein
VTGSDAPRQSPSRRPRSRSRRRVRQAPTRDHRQQRRRKQHGCQARSRVVPVTSNVERVYPFQVLLPEGRRTAARLESAGRAGPVDRGGAGGHAARSPGRARRRRELQNLRIAGQQYEPVGGGGRDREARDGCASARSPRRLTTRPAAPDHGMSLHRTGASYRRLGYGEPGTTFEPRRYRRAADRAEWPAVTSARCRSRARSAQTAMRLTS